MQLQLFLVALLPLFDLITAHGKHQKRQASGTTPALNPVQTNLIPQAPRGPTLYYNGSGPVPLYNQTTPSPAPLPKMTSQEIENDLYNELFSIASGVGGIKDKCSSCIAGAEIMHLTAITQGATTITNLLIRLCDSVPTIQDSIDASSCYEAFSGIGNAGPYYAQLFTKMNLATSDMQGWCYYKWGLCEAPATIAIDESHYFSPKPESANKVPEPSEKSLNVLHISDWHLDTRYDIGSEANCTQYLCCRPYATNVDLNSTSVNPTLPASRFGYFYCDSPPDLALSAFAEMDHFINRADINFTIFTGDIVSHDAYDQLSLAYTEYVEQVTYQTFKAWMGKSPIYPTLGNHDTFPEAFNTPNSINNSTGQSNTFSWNYDFLSTLWLEDGWISNSTANYASNHYGAYATVTAQGLKIISINTDFWLVANPFNYYNMTNPDNSGILAFLASELQASEDCGQRVWIIGHVLSGYDFGTALPNPSALFYSIIRRYSPSTIAGVFFGHTHEDQLMIYYDYLPNSIIPSNGTSILRNTTLVDYSKPLQVGNIGPSITPLTGYNAGWVIMEVDAKTFSVKNQQTYFANMSESLTWTTPQWSLEYDTRAAYDPNNTWPSASPLNATFWHDVTEQMLQNNSIVEMYNLYETKSSVFTQNCSTPACAAMKVCYIRSGSSSLGGLCPTVHGPS